MKSDITIMLDDYANGAIDKAELKTKLEGVGYSAQVVNILLIKSDILKRKVELEKVKAIKEGYNEETESGQVV